MFMFRLLIHSLLSDSGGYTVHGQMSASSQASVSFARATIEQFEKSYSFIKKDETVSRLNLCGDLFRAAFHELYNGLDPNTQGGCGSGGDTITGIWLFNRYCTTKGTSISMISPMWTLMPIEFIVNTIVDTQDQSAKTSESYLHEDEEPVPVQPSSSLERDVWYDADLYESEQKELPNEKQSSGYHPSQEGPQQETNENVSEESNPRREEGHDHSSSTSSSVDDDIPHNNNVEEDRPTNENANTPTFVFSHSTLSPYNTPEFTPEQMREFFPDGLRFDIEKNEYLAQPEVITEEKEEEDSTTSTRAYIRDRIVQLVISDYRDHVINNNNIAPDRTDSFVVHTDSNYKIDSAGGGDDEDDHDSVVIHTDSNYKNTSFDDVNDAGSTDVNVDYKIGGDFLAISYPIQL